MSYSFEIFSRVFTKLLDANVDNVKVTTEEFKMKLDLFLSNLPDHPIIVEQVPHLKSMHRKPSNLLTDVIIDQKNINGGG